ncbi:MAG: hypothetical protein HXY20_12260 [Acidobacteria bacterium]|nr:hypothetical protein [Acidobacteriota bacterium]
MKNPSKTGPQQDRISIVLNWIKANVDEDCAKWLASLSTTIDKVLGDPTDEESVVIGHGEFDRPLIAAFTNNDPFRTDLPPGYAIAVNDTGAFFSDNYVVAGHSGGSSQAQVFILLHEFAHLLEAPGFKPDFESKKAGSANDRLATKHCGKTVNNAKSIS